MKICEPLGGSSNLDSVEDVRRKEALLIDKMKTEFQDFVAVTRERLRLATEALIEIDRDLSEPKPNIAPVESLTRDECTAPPAVAKEPLVEARSQPAAVESDVDPFERLNAIKQRLARQIEKS